MVCGINTYRYLSLLIFRLPSLRGLTRGCEYKIVELQHTELSLTYIKEKLNLIIHI